MSQPDPITPNPAVRLAELRLDRGARTEHRRRSLTPVVLVLAVLAGAGVAVFAVRQKPTVASAAASAEAAAKPVDARSFGERAPSVLDATGYVVARRQATVSAETTGKVAEILIEEGMTVAPGQVIGHLEDDVEQAELALAVARVDAARAALRELEAQLAHAARTLARTRSLAEQNLASRAALDEQRLARDALEARLLHAHREVTVAERQVALQRRRLAKMTIRAPFAGVVVNKAAQPGEMVSPISAGGGFTRTGIGTIVDMSSLEVEVDVNEAYINRVHTGQPVTVTLNGYPDRAYSAEVVTIVPAADRSRATVPVRVALLDVDDRVLPEMGVRVSFLTGHPGVGADSRPRSPGVGADSAAAAPIRETPLIPSKESRTGVRSYTRNHPESRTGVRSHTRNHPESRTGIRSHTPNSRK